MEESGRLQSMKLQRVGHDRVTSLSFYSSFWRRKWQPTPVFLPGESHGQRGLIGYSLWGHKESDMTKQLTHTHTHTHTPQFHYRLQRETCPWATWDTLIVNPSHMIHEYVKCFVSLTFSLSKVGSKYTPVDTENRCRRQLDSVWLRKCTQNWANHIEKEIRDYQHTFLLCRIEKVFNLKKKNPSRDVEWTHWCMRKKCKRVLDPWPVGW